MQNVDGINASKDAPVEAGSDVGVESYVGVDQDVGVEPDVGVEIDVGVEPDVGIHDIFKHQLITLLIFAILVSLHHNLTYDSML